MAVRADWSWKPPVDLLGHTEADLRLMKSRRRLTKYVPPIITEGKHIEFYRGEVPPWDPSLGDFICFEGCCGQMRTILTETSETGST